MSPAEGAITSSTQPIAGTLLTTRSGWQPAPVLLGRVPTSLRRLSCPVVRERMAQAASRYSPARRGPTGLRFMPGSPGRSGTRTAGTFSSGQSAFRDRFPLSAQQDRKAVKGPMPGPRRLRRWKCEFGLPPRHEPLEGVHAVAVGDLASTEPVHEGNRRRSAGCRCRLEPLVGQQDDIDDMAE